MEARNDRFTACVFDFAHDVNGERRSSNASMSQGSERACQASTPSSCGIPRSGNDAAVCTKCRYSRVMDRGVEMLVARQRRVVERMSDTVHPDDACLCGRRRLGKILCVECRTQQASKVVIFVVPTFDVRKHDVVCDGYVNAALFLARSEVNAVCVRRDEFPWSQQRAQSRDVRAAARQQSKSSRQIFRARKLARHCTVLAVGVTFGLVADVKRGGCNHDAWFSVRRRCGSKVRAEHASESVRERSESFVVICIIAVVKLGVQFGTSWSRCVCERRVRDGVNVGGVSEWLCPSSRRERRTKFRGVAVREYLEYVHGHALVAVFFRAASA
mmetsp:Transcript_12099/g.32068  ORF Transcript_12099/g.32068 Transcript_12099/m.32068 type:complete len:329 (+) Transcript_12099:2731-3717(+)